MSLMLREKKQALKVLRAERAALIIELRSKRAAKKDVEKLIKEIRSEIAYRQGKNRSW